MSNDTVIHINKWGDLRQFGFNTLTGESCRFGQRLLVDLNQQAVNILSAYLGCVEFKSENWNSGSIRSVMLTYGAWKDIAIFALLTSGYYFVIEFEDRIDGFKNKQDFDNMMYFLNESKTESKHGFIRTWSDMLAYQKGSAGDRNEHLMSGRVS